MYISLRKAAALQKEIQAALPNVATSATVSIYENDVTSLLSAATEETAKALEDRHNLMISLNIIRDLTAEANFSSGIYKLVSRLALLEKQIAFYSALAKAEVMPAEPVIKATVERARNANPDHYSFSFSDKVAFSIMDKDTIEELKLLVASFKKEKVKIQDELLELNIKHSIKLSDEIVAVLTAHKLI